MAKLSPENVQGAWTNITSILDVPRDLLPVGPARSALYDRAAAGEDCYAYQSGGSHGVWCVWLDDQRIPVTEYVAGFAAESAAPHD